MRTLKFIVDKQVISLDPKCDFTGLYPGSSGYLQAKFIFSSEWLGTVKVAAFFSNLGKEYSPQLLGEDNTCMIPMEALEKRKFKVQIIGKDGNTKLTTNKVTVSQNGGKE